MKLLLICLILYVFYIKSQVTEGYFTCPAITVSHATDKTKTIQKGNSGKTHTVQCKSGYEGGGQWKCKKNKKSDLLYEWKETKGRSCYKESLDVCRDKNGKLVGEGINDKMSKCENIDWACKGEDCPTRKNKKTGKVEVLRNDGRHCIVIKHFKEKSQKSEQYYAKIMQKAKQLCEETEKCNGFTAYIGPTHKSDFGVRGDEIENAQLCFREIVQLQGSYNFADCHEIKGTRKAAQQKAKVSSVSYKGPICKKESSSGKKESSSGKKESSSGKRRKGIWWNNKSSSGKKESSSGKKESSSGKKESSSGKECKIVLYNSEKGTYTAKSGSKVSIGCKSGYMFDKETETGGDIVLICDDGSFDKKVTEKCIKKGCNKNQVPHSNKKKIGSLAGKRFSTEEVLCDEDYAMGIKDGKFITKGTWTCNENGDWRGPACKRICPKKQFLNSNEGSLMGIHGSKYDLSCKDDYTGGGEVLCKSTGEFSKRECVEKTQIEKIQDDIEIIQDDIVTIQDEVIDFITDIIPL